MNPSIPTLALIFGLTSACGSAEPEGYLAAGHESAPGTTVAPIEPASSQQTPAGAAVGSTEVQEASALATELSAQGMEDKGNASQAPVLAAAQEQEPETPAVEEGFDATHAAWSALLDTYVKKGRVDYGAWKKNAEHRAALTAYLATLVEVTPEELKDWSKPARLAYWINVYNASVVNLIVENYPLKSIEDLTTKELKVWDRTVVALGAHLEERPNGLSLNDVEHEIVRGRFTDARIHAALNCGAESCPPLLNEAFRAEDLDEQLEAQMRAFVGDATRNEFNGKKKRVKLSRLFEWFAGDFERDAGSVNAYVQRYAPEEFASWAGKPKKVEFLDYSWKLNDVER